MKIIPRENGKTRRWYEREKWFLSSHRVSPFSRGVNFTRACVSPWEKMGTTRSLPVGKNAGVAKQISLSLKSSNSRVFLLLFQFFLVELTPTLQWIHRIYVTVFLELSNLPQVTFQNGRFSGAMLALLTRKSSIISSDTSLLKNILHAICKLLCAKFCVVTKNLSYFLSSAANDLRQVQL